MTPSVCHTGLTSVQRVREEDEEGIAAESTTIKCKVSAPAVQLVGTKGACETCKKVGVVAECVYGISAACAQCKSARLHCSLARAARAEEAHRSSGELGGGGCRRRDDKK